MFKYGGFKLFLLKIFFGTLLVIFSTFLLTSLITYSADDPGIGKLNGTGEVKNVLGFWGALSSSIVLSVLGELSHILIIFVLYAGIVTIVGIGSVGLVLKGGLIILSIIFLNFSQILLDFKIFKTGFFSIFLFDLFYFNFPFLVNSLFYKLLITLILVVISLVLLVYSFSIKKTFLKYLSLKILSITLFALLKPLRSYRFKRNKKSYKSINISKEKNEPTLLKKTKIFSNRNKPDVKNDYNDFVFKLPDTDFLKKSNLKNTLKKELEHINKNNSTKLEQVLEEYGVIGKIIGYKSGPIVTLYEFVPNAGIKASKIIGLADDIARAMSSVSARISSQPGKTSLGIEIPNPKREDVMFGDLVSEQKFDELNSSLTLALGKNISGQVVYADLEKMPHLLIAGTTGSGKSVGINTIIMSILYRFKPDECKLILIDPKMLELSVYEDIPHLLTPVVTNPNKAVFALKWVVKEMENRYKLMSVLNVKNINSYNYKSKKIRSTGKKLFRSVQTGIDNDTRKPIFEKREIPLEKMPFIVVVIDEMADLMMVAGKEVESLVQRLAQMARASGIHLVTATQRPSVDVITGTIKANFPSRLSYKVASKFDSRTILNEMGAEQLLGRGDMLFLENGANLKRLHGGFISENEIESVVNSIKEQAIFDQKKEISLDEPSEESSMGLSFGEGEIDALYSKAVEIVIKQQKVSTSYIQRYLQIGYNRAARIVEKMEDEGIISEANNAGKRQVLKKN